MRAAMLQTEAVARLRDSIIVRDERERLASVGRGGLVWREVEWPVSRV
jgi:hypothetical protein